MTTRIDPTRPTSDMKLLHPKARGRFEKLASALLAAHNDKETPTLFLPFETYRYPQRQDFLQRTTTNTKANAFESAHQFGLAVDFVPYDTTWSWSEHHDWGFLRSTSQKFGLDVPIKWDLAHVEHPAWKWLQHEFKVI